MLWCAMMCCAMMTYDDHVCAVCAQDNDDVTALMVYNGPGVKDLWQMNDIISALRKRKHDLLTANGSA